MVIMFGFLNIDGNYATQLIWESCPKVEKMQTKGGGTVIFGFWAFTRQNLS